MRNIKKNFDVNVDLIPKNGDNFYLISGDIHDRDKNGLVDVRCYKLTIVEENKKYKIHNFFID